MKYYSKALEKIKFSLENHKKISLNDFDEYLTMIYKIQ
jgi:hypothetical protein